VICTTESNSNQNITIEPFYKVVADYGSRAPREIGLRRKCGNGFGRDRSNIRISQWFLVYERIVERFINVLKITWWFRCADGSLPRRHQDARGVLVGHTRSNMLRTPAETALYGCGRERRFIVPCRICKACRKNRKP